MRLIQNPNRWSCILAAFAMVLDAEMDELIKEIGHDGSEVWWEDVNPPMCYRGFHVQEFLDLCMKRGKIFGVVESVLTLGGRGRKIPRVLPGDYEKRWNSYLRNFKGVITGELESRGRHAVAWDKNKIFDPRGRIVDPDDTDLEADTFYPIFNL